MIINDLITNETKSGIIDQIDESIAAHQLRSLGFVPGMQIMKMFETWNGAGYKLLDTTIAIDNQTANNICVDSVQR